MGLIVFFQVAISPNIIFSITDFQYSVESMEHLTLFLKLIERGAAAPCEPSLGVFGIEETVGGVSFERPNGYVPTAAWHLLQDLGDCFQGCEQKLL